MSWALLTREIADIDWLEGETNAETLNAETVRAEQGRITNEELGLIFGDLDVSPRVAAARDGARGALTVQPSGGDGAGSVEVFPSGTSNRSHFLATNNSDPDNFGFVEFEVNGQDAWLHSTSKGTGSKPRQFKFRSFPDGIRTQNSLLVGAVGFAPTSPLHVDHAGNNISAAKIGDNADATSNTGIYLRTKGTGKIFTADSGTLELLSDNTNGKGLILENGGRARVEDLMNLPPQSAEPATPTAGDIACQDGVNWDPAATGAEEIVAYLNGGWVALS